MRQTPSLLESSKNDKEECLLERSQNQIEYLQAELL